MQTTRVQIDIGYTIKVSFYNFSALFYFALQNIFV